MQVGMTKDQSLYNKPSAAVHPGTLAAGILPEYNVIPNKCFIFVLCRIVGGMLQVIMFDSKGSLTFVEACTLVSPRFAVR